MINGHTQILGHHVTRHRATAKKPMTPGSPAKTAVPAGVKRQNRRGGPAVTRPAVTSQVKRKPAK